MTEEEYLEKIKLENQQHRELMRQDYLNYIESVKNAMLEIQNTANEASLRASFVSAALNALLAANNRYLDNPEIACETAIVFADELLKQFQRSA